MKISPTLERLLAGALAIAAAMLWFSWRAAQKNSLDLKATLVEKNEVLMATQDALAKAQADIAETERQAAEIEAKTKTPAEILKSLPAYLPLPKPLDQTYFCQDAASGACSPPHSEEPDAPQLPAPETRIDIPQEDLKPLFDFSVQCQACENVVAKQKEALRLFAQEVDDLKAERDAAVKAAKGGGFWRRLKSNAHWFAIGGAAAAGALCGTGHCK
jgi:hypothetical protein